MGVQDGSAPASQSSPDSGFAVTPSDSTTLQTTWGLWVGGAGTLVVTMAGDGSVLTFAGIPAGTWMPIRVKKVMAATTASLIVAAY